MSRTPVDEAVHHHALAVELHEGCHLDGALDHALIALDLLQRECGPGHPDIANVLNALSVIREDRCEYEEAARLARRAVGIMAEVAGDEDVLVRLRVQALARLACVQRVQGCLAEAEAGYQQALALVEAGLPPGDPEMASLLNGLGVVYKYAGRFDEGEAATGGRWR